MCYACEGVAHFLAPPNLTQRGGMLIRNWHAEQKEMKEFSTL